MDQEWCNGKDLVLSPADSDEVIFLPRRVG